MSVKIRLACLLTLSTSLLVFPGCESSCNQPLSATPSSPSSDDQAALDETAEPKLVSFKVEGMTCPSGCYPSVKSAIAKQKGVIGIELAPQKQADAIDNPIVFVKYKGNLDLDSTLKAISRAGFEAQEVAN
ncbi:MAG: heavy metal-associated domain-containing protein [Planctomycetota bacterium]|nr:heavy metal-associated domain-containing protein [Planctomycetota bacterium]